MIGEILTEHPWLGPLAWQSTLCLAAGLGGSFLLRRHAVRAHQVLLLGLVAAVLIPALSQIVKRNQWGLLVAERAVATPERQPVAAPTEFAIPDEPITTEPANVPQPTGVREAVPASTKTRFDWTRVVLPAWLAISSVLLVRLAVQFLLGLRLAKRSEVVDDAQLLQMIEAAKGKLGIQAEVRVRASAQAHSPVIWCWARRPVLLVPTEPRHDEGLDWPSILCHELAHAKRRDHVSGLLAELMVCALPWQPLAWWARQRLTALSEEACDDWVIACGQRASDYARTLLGLIPQGQATFLPGVVTARSGLAGRVRRILEDGCTNPHAGLQWTLAFVILAVCISLGIAFAQTRPAAQSPKVPDAASQAQVTTPPDTKPPVNENLIQLRLVDADGRPVAGAKVAEIVFVHELAVPGSRENVHRADWYPRTDPSDEDGHVVLARLPRDTIAVYALHEERGIGAFREIARENIGEMQSMVLKPVCRLHGTCDSAGLAAIGIPLRSINASVRYDSDNHPQMLEYSTNAPKHDFDFLLPPGAYALSLNGSGSGEEEPPFITVRTEFTRVLITVPEGRPTFDLGVIDLRPTKWATLIGHPAPELGPMKAWKSGSPVTLADLRGHVVWLRFGAGQSLLAGNLPELVKLHQALGDRGLTIIMISSNASLEEMDEQWSKMYQPFEGVREVPFRIAIDGDAATDREGASWRIGATFERYGIVGYPTDILIDSAGNVVGQPTDVYRAKELISRMLAVQPESPGPARGQRFDEIYRLADGQILKRIAPPFMPERAAFLRKELDSRAQEVGKAIPGYPDRIVFRWDGRLKMYGFAFGDVNSLGAVLHDVLELKRYEYDGPPSLLTLPLAGDWIVRNGAPREGRLRALEELVARELGRRIRFEQRSVEREAIIATGGFQFHPPAAAEEDTAIHLSAAGTGPDERALFGTAQSVSAFLQMLGDLVNMPALNQTGRDGSIRMPYVQHRSSIGIREVRDEREKLRQVQVLLDHVTAQTELKLEIRKEQVDVRFMTE